MSALSSCVFFLVLNLKGSLLFYLWISFSTFRLLIVLYCSIKFIMSLSVISLFSFYMTNKFLWFVHFFIKWSLDSCAWHFFIICTTFLHFLPMLVTQNFHLLPFGVLSIDFLLFYGLKVFCIVVFVP